MIDYKNNKIMEMSDFFEEVMSMISEFALMDASTDNQKLFLVLDKHIKRLEILESFAVFDLPDNFEFQMALVSDPKYIEFYQKEILKHIEDGCVAWAMGQFRPYIGHSQTVDAPVILIPIGTKRRIHGMFLAINKQGKYFSGEVINLLRIMLSSCASTLDNFELTRYQKRLNEQLEIRVESRTAELRAALEQIERTSHYREAFLSSISQEIRTPLNNIVSVLHLIDAIDFDQDVKEVVKHAVQSTQQLTKLFNEMIELSRKDPAQSNLNLAEVSFQEIEDVLLSQYRPKAKEKQIDLNWNRDPKLPTSIVSDSTRLLQILDNLVHNALKFTSEGQVDINLVLQEEAQDRMLVRIEVADTGKGIFPEDQEKIRSIFEQLDFTMAQQLPGTGIGLALVKRLVDMFNGWVKLESQPDKGSVFSVHIWLLKVSSS